ncbi:hypothetical protein [Secundilactobacillus kimchicus]
MIEELLFRGYLFNAFFKKRPIVAAGCCEWGRLFISPCKQ